MQPESTANTGLFVALHSVEVQRLSAPHATCSHSQLPALLQLELRAPMNFNSAAAFDGRVNPSSTLRLLWVSSTERPCVINPPPAGVLWSALSTLGGYLDYSLVPYPFGPVRKRLDVTAASGLKCRLMLACKIVCAAMAIATLCA